MPGAEPAGRRGSGAARRPLAAAAGALLLACAAVARPAPADAAAPAGHLTHPQLDWAGSTIRAHEPAARPGPARTLRRAAAAPAVARTPGMDVSAYQGSVDWPAARRKGARFAYVKATESTSYTNPSFTQQYNGSYRAGLIRGAYHFATPDTSSGTAQADWFVSHGGGWSKDGRTLPPMLDIEYNPYGAECYGRSRAAMVAWIRGFVAEVHRRTTRWAVIYTTTAWWRACTGNSRAFAARDPLSVAHYGATAGPLPAGWPTHTFWQWADAGALPGDQDRFNGALSRVQALADNT